MNADKNSINFLLSMSDEEFSQKIDLITKKLGMGQNGVSPARVRMMLGSMSEGDISQLLSSLGKERTDEIMKIINGGI